ncbi:MAG: FAD-dependent oxidoreductase, partial [Pirellulales bacterium]|nr:FAD-dependent oxidoreductase [Pirellulales bacterium]
MSEHKRIVIVGGVAGGASAAARSRRLSESAEIIVFERGEHVSFANCGLPYHIGGEIEEREKLLMHTPESLLARFHIDARVRHEVVSVDCAKHEVIVRNLDSGEVFQQGYDNLILSPGAEPIVLPIAGARSDRVLTLRNMADMDAINSVLDEKQPTEAVVVGGGYIGLEMVEALYNRGLKVTLVELAEQVMGAADAEMVSPLQQELVLRGINLRLGTSASEILVNGDGSDKLRVCLDNGETINCGLVVMAVGVRPETTLARDAGLKIGKLGGILVDDHMRTSDPDIYAVGDAVEVKDFLSNVQSLIPLAGPANRQGRIAADNVFGRQSTYKKTQGTAICKVFNLGIGMTGLSEKALKKLGIAHEKIYVHPFSHAGYFPGASPVSLKLLFDPNDGRILGAQAVGAGGIDKRIDILAIAIRAGLSVFDLEEFELSYAPPYGSAKDVVNYAGFVASNVLRGDVRLCHCEDIFDLKADQELLDVRDDEEVAAGTIEGAVHVPVDQLRNRLDELSKDKEWLL